MKRLGLFYGYCVLTISLTLIALINKIVIVTVTPAQRGDLPVHDVIFAFLWGLRFDLAIAALFSFFTIWLIKLFAINRLEVSLRWAIPAMFFLSLAQVGDYIYFLDANRHISYEIKDFFVTPGSLINQGWNSVSGSFEMLVAAFILTYTISIGWFTPIKLCLKNQSTNWWKTVVTSTGILILMVVFVRGGPIGIPLSPSTAFNIGNNQQALVALNGAYSGTYSLLTSKNFVEPTELSFEPVSLKPLYETDAAKYQDDVQQYNVVFVLLESWSTERQLYQQTPSVTPNFDQIQKKSLSSDRMIAGGHRTTEGMYASFCSAINPLGKSIAKTQLQMHSYQCLPQLLRDKGWDTAFYQGSYKDTSRVGSFAQSLGFERSFGKLDFPSDTRYEKNAWGYHDADIYDFAFNQISSGALKEPFLAGINTNTTHDSSLPKGVEGVFSDPLLNTLHFADAALGKFFQDIEKLETQLPTIVVLVADHTARLGSSPLSEYSIPWALYIPENESMGRKIPQTVSQRDLAPTLTHFLGIDAPWFSGLNLLTTNDQRFFANYYHQNQIGWIRDDILYQIDLSDKFAVSCFDWRGDIRNPSEIECPADAEEQRSLALSFTKIQQDLLFNGKTFEFSEYKHH